MLKKFICVLVISVVIGDDNDVVIVVLFGSVYFCQVVFS